MAQHHFLGYRKITLPNGNEQVSSECLCGVTRTYYKIAASGRIPKYLKSADEQLIDGQELPIYPVYHYFRNGLKLKKAGSCPLAK